MISRVDAYVDITALRDNCLLNFHICILTLGLFRFNLENLYISSQKLVKNITNDRIKNNEN